MQSKLVDAARAGNIEQLQSVLKSAELKTTLQQSANLAAKQPDNLALAAENLRASQNAAKLEAQKPELQRPNLLERSLSRAKEMLGIQQMQMQQTQPMREDISLRQAAQQQISLQANLASKILPFRDTAPQNQAMQNPAAYMSRQTNQQAQITPISRAEQTRPVSEPARESAKPNDKPFELKPVEEQKKTEPSKPNISDEKKVDEKLVVKPTEDKKPDEAKKADDKPPTKAETKELRWCCRPENQGKLTPPAELAPQHQVKPTDVVTLNNQVAANTAQFNKSAESYAKSASARL
jgi:hypothetical protein